jgi:hypothetical protein
MCKAGLGKNECCSQPLGLLSVCVNPIHNRPGLFFQLKYSTINYFCKNTRFRPRGDIFSKPEKFYYFFEFSAIFLFSVLFWKIEEHIARIWGKKIHNSLSFIVKCLLLFSTGYDKIDSI